MPQTPEPLKDLARKVRRADAQSGNPRRVPAAPARRHLTRLTGAGFNVGLLSTVLGRSRATLNKILSGEVETIHRDLQRQITDLTPASILRAAPDHATVPAIGTQRRIMALQAIGYRAVDLLPKKNAVRVLGSSTVRMETHKKIAEIYEELSYVDGPSRGSRKWAAAHEYPPPIAWAGIDMDNPWASPHAERAKSPAKERVERVEDMLEHNVDPDAIASAFGIKRRSLATAMRRAGRADLARKVDEAA